MATSVRGPDARPAAGSCCKFELKKYDTRFTCSVCKTDDFEPKRYRCDHCDLSRHEGCIQLDKNIKIDSSSPISHWKGGVLELYNKPQIRAGKSSNTRKRAKQCMLCTEPVKHYSYHYLVDKEKDINMHPRCADRIARSEGSLSSTLKLEAGKKRCMWCRQDRPNGACTDKFSCWSYLWKRSDRPDMYIHVYCYSKMMIWARKRTVPSENSNDDILKISRKRKRIKGHVESEWEALAEEAIGLLLDHFLGGGVGLIPVISSLFR